MRKMYVRSKKNQWLLILLLSMVFGPVAGQEDPVNFRALKGEVVDSRTKDPLVFATLLLEGSNISTVTNTEGEFLLKIPSEIQEGNVLISFLGYKSKSLPLEWFQEKNNSVALGVGITQLAEVDVSAPKSALNLVKSMMAKRGENYFNDATTMTAFYRETIKKRRRNVSLSEAVVTIYKSPYLSSRRDAVSLYKARKSTDYSKMDTLALKLQGGPYNALYVDIMKYPDYLFSSESIKDYDFTFDRSTNIDNKRVYVVNFEQKEGIMEPLYRGKLYIDAEKRILNSAIFSLKITNKELAARLFVRKKPRNAKVYPTEVAYRVDYREKDGRWYYGYSNAIMTFKVNWDKKLFNSVYSMTSEMAITDWEKNENGDVPKSKDRMKRSIIMSDEAVGFSDPDFWGEYNIIEPEKSIESAIKKIQRQLKKERAKTG
ncbi:MAG: carboxypeptidase-like regulatory domain-containing protein [Eudoraea sp.]|nr:carboxypeptidase-like regulatory domain-containing protein [Eudoraea sp.]